MSRTTPSRLSSFFSITSPDMRAAASIDDLTVVLRLSSERDATMSPDAIARPR